MALLSAAGLDGVPNPWFSWSFVTDNVSDILTAAREHVTLTLVSVALGLAVSLPLALVARRYRWLQTPVLGVSGVLYSVPALAFIVALVPPLGLGAATVVVPLVAYSLIILVRNILTGLEDVPADVVDAARGMGYGPLRRLLRIELPLAVPAIVAGLRIATVSTIELVVIGAYVGKGGFGDFILQGFQNNFYRAEVTTGVVLTVLLALVADLLLVGVQRLVTPWARSR